MANSTEGSDGKLASVSERVNVLTVNKQLLAKLQLQKLPRKEGERGRDESPTGLIDLYLILE